MKLPIKKGRTSLLLSVFIQDSSSTTGAGLTGLVFNSSGLVAYVGRADDGNAGGTAITLATATRGTWTSGGFKEKDASNMPGVYELGIPNAAIATGSDWVIIVLKGATNMAPLVLELHLTDIDFQDSVRHGLTALPNAAAEAAGGLYTRGSGAGQINQPANGMIDGNVVRWSGTAVATPDTAGYPKVTVKVGTGTGEINLASGKAPATIAVGDIANNAITAAAIADAAIDRATFAVDTGLQTVRSSTAQAGAAGTITLDASASATDSFYNGCEVTITGGTGAGQTRVISGYVGSTKVASVDHNWATNPDNTSTFAILSTDAPKLDSSLRPTDVNSANLDAAVSSRMATFTLPTNFASLAIDASGRVNAFLVGILTSVFTEGAAGRIAAAFKQFFNIATPAATMDHGVLVDTVTTYTGNTPQTGDAYARIGAPAGASVSADVAAVKADTGTTLTDVNTGAGAIYTRIGAPAGASLAADVAAVKAVLPAALVSGRIDASVGAVAANAITAAAIADAAIDRATFAADTGLLAIRSGTAQSGGGTSITLDAGASATTDFYKNALVQVVSGTGAGQGRFCTAYNGSTKVATVGTAWATNPDNTSVFVITAFDSIPGATAPTAAQVATAVWTDLLSGSDFSTASSVGKLLKDDVDAAISSRSTFAGGAVASVTAGVTVTTNNDKTGYALTSAYDPAKTAAQTGDAMALTSGERTTLAAAIWNALTSGLTTVGSIGKRIVDFLTGDAYARLGAPAGASVSADIAAVKSDSGGIKTQTDKLAFSVTNQVDANVLDWKSATAPAMTGDAFARIGAPAGASVSADVAAIKADTGTTLADVNTGAGAIYTRIGAPAGASLAADLAAAKVDTAAIKAKTDNLPSGIKKNTALTAFEFFMADSGDHVTGKTGLTVTAQVSIDGAAFTNTANSPSEVSSGIYKINLAAGDLNGTVITLKFTASGADATLLTLHTES